MPWFKDMDVVLLGLSNTKFDRRRLIDTRGFWIVKCEAKWRSGIRVSFVFKSGNF